MNLLLLVVVMVRSSLLESNVALDSIWGMRGRQQQQQQQRQQQQQQQQGQRRWLWRPAVPPLLLYPQLVVVL
jgi:hypothetical protein